MNQATIRSWIWFTLKLTLVAIVFIVLMRKCTNTTIEAEKGNYDSLFAKIKADSLWRVQHQKKYDSLEVKLVASERKGDSLIKIKSKVEQRYMASSKAVRDLLKNGICDSVRIIVALDDCDSLEIVNKEVIASKDTTINILKSEKQNLLEDKAKQEGINEAARQIIAGQANDYEGLKKASKKALRRQKLKTVGVVVLGALSVALTVFLLK